jgi:hypothetical protein
VKDDSEKFSYQLLDELTKRSSAAGALAEAVRRRDRKRDVELVLLCAEKLKQRRYRKAADALLEMLRSDEL